MRYLICVLMFSCLTGCNDIKVESIVDAAPVMAVSARPEPPIGLVIASTTTSSVTP